LAGKSKSARRRSKRAVAHHLIEALLVEWLGRIRSLARLLALGAANSLSLFSPNLLFRCLVGGHGPATRSLRPVNPLTAVPVPACFDPPPLLSATPGALAAGRAKPLRLNARAPRSRADG